VRLVFDNSFYEAQKLWSAQIASEVGQILKCLEANPFFLPDRAHYQVEQCLDEGFCVCQANSGWEGWKLVWAMEVSMSIIAPVESLLIMAHFDPIVRLLPNRR
jgi:hypothetical protein